MNKYRRFVIIFLLLEICLIGICNLFVVQALKSKDEYSYRVDVARCVQELETGIPLEQIKLSDYPTLTRVSIFDAQEVCNEEYRVEEVQGKLYRFCYRRTVQTGSGAGRVVDLYSGISDTARKKTGSPVCVDGRTNNRTCKRESVCTNQGRKKPFLRKIPVESGYVAGKAGGG